jgi:DNA polymerase-3 subunit alpha
LRPRFTDLGATVSNADFAHLHLHTQYSFLDGAIRMKDLIKKLKSHGMTSCAVTDHGNMFGLLDFYQQATAAGINPILGMEAYVTGVTGDTKHTDQKRENFHLVLLAENNTGYDNLKKLSTRAFTHGKYYFPRVDRDLLKQHSEGIIALTACLGGEVGRKAMKDDRDGARAAARTLRDIFGPKNFFLEVQPNGVPEQDKVNAFLAELANDEGFEMAATNDCHYVEREHHEAQNILMAIKQQLPWGDPKLHTHKTDAFYVRSGDEMHDLLKTDHLRAFENTCEIAKRCKVKLTLGKYYLPPFPTGDATTSEADYLVHLAYKGLERRFTEISYKIDRDKYKARLQIELDCIIKMGFPGYFLIVQDFINWSKQNLVRVGPGRGSGAGSLVAYALRITDLDPLPYDLLFERFLNPERVSMPDFDVDFMQAGRGKVIDYVAQKYGRDRVGQIATYSGMNPKSAIKDVARTLGISFTEINELTKPIPPILEGHKLDFETALEHAPALKQKAETDPTYKKTIQVARTLEGLFRQAGMHAGGVVIGEKDLVEYVPCFSGNNGEYVTQFDKDKVEAAGLVKFDFLGLKTLDVIESCERLVNARIDAENKLPPEQRAKAAQKHNHALRAPGFTPGDVMPPLVVDVLALDEDKVYKLIASGDTLGVFQVESSGMREMCRKLKPTCFEDVVAGVALYRPGPMEAGMLDSFIDRKHGREKIAYPHPLLEPVLKPTYGTVVYQEQVMQSAQVLAGYSLGGADLLRRAMGKKKPEEMQKQKGKFVDGCATNNISAAQASEIFDTIEKFAGYGFNKSHSAAYALVTYQTAYLKCFYPIEFMAALLTTEVSSTENVVKYIQEARSKGIEVLPPDVNVSEISFSVDYNVDDALKNRRKHRGTTYGRIRFGLSAVKGMGDSALDAILESRGRIGRFESFYHFLEEVPQGKINRKVLEVMIKSGALDSFGKPRDVLFASIDKALSIADANRTDANSAQFSLFGAAATKRPEVYDPPAEAWGPKERLQFEREAIGFYLSGHPLDRYLDDARKLGAVPSPELTTMRNNAEATIVGIVAALKERKLKTSDGRWAVVTLEDTFGQAEVLCFSKAYEAAESLLKSGEPLLVKGRAVLDDVDDEGKQMMPKMRVESVQSLAEAQMQRTRWLDITLEATAKPGAPPRAARLGAVDPASDVVDDAVAATLEKVATLCQGAKGAVPARIKLEMPGGYAVVVQSGDACRVTPTEELITQIGRLKGVLSVVRS